MNVNRHCLFFYAILCPSLIDGRKKAASMGAFGGIPRTCYVARFAFLPSGLGGELTAPDDGVTMASVS